VVVASRTLDKIKKLIGNAKNVEAVQCDVETDADLKTLEQLTVRSDLVVSMLPYLFHPRAAKFALQYGKHFLTTSYVSPAMRELEAEAVKKGLVMVNECGVDPGTDHMSAMKVIHDVERRGGKIVSFTSYCGGLPAPDSNNNPFGYKLSWAPRGVLLASVTTLTSSAMARRSLFLERTSLITLRRTTSRAWATSRPIRTATHANTSTSIRCLLRAP